MKTITLIFLLCSLSVTALAGDVHQDGQGHKVVYTVVDNTGQPVSGQTVRLAVERVSDESQLDFSDNTFKSSGWTTRYQTMAYNSTLGFYWYVVTIDTAVLVSGDYVCVVSNDDATYGDRQAESVQFDITNNLIKIHR